jgi:hypothetical protein
VPGGAHFKTPPWHLQLFTAPIKAGDSNSSRLPQDFPAGRLIVLTRGAILKAFLGKAQCA